MVLISGVAMEENIDEVGVDTHHLRMDLDTSTIMRDKS